MSLLLGRVNYETEEPGQPTLVVIAFHHSSSSLGPQASRPLTCNPLNCRRCVCATLRGGRDARWPVTGSTVDVVFALRSEAGVPPAGL
jgi:hypothetical protein